MGFRNSATRTGVHRAPQNFFSSSVSAPNRFLHHIVVLFLFFFSSCTFLFIGATLFYNHINSSTQRFQFQHICGTHSFIHLFTYFQRVTILRVYDNRPLWFFIFVSLKIRGVGQLFMCLLAIYTYSLERCLVKSFAYTLIVFFFFFLCYVFFILWVLILYLTNDWQVWSHSAC